ncbi:MAG: 6-carboxytetrahydropterin synthase, partial [Rhodocyclaceae bacterium]|nr:6-carboxytetrahydropterin synthase [Rhodocyclaceae bacterium]
MRITRRLEFDAGHRIPDHRSQCRHLHGNRYALEITPSGEVIERNEEQANDMVIDFGDIKTIA